jgi:exonuclease III
LALIVLLNTEFIDLDILCFSEHWLNYDQMKTLNIEYYKLVKNFSRISRNSGGSCTTWVRKDLQAREVSYLKGLGSENDFEMTEVELVDFRIILVCIYRSTHSDFCTFLNKLETVICKVQMKGMKLMLCGDWNINFLQDSAQLRALQNILNTYNLINTVTSPTRVAKIQYH